MPDGFVNGPEPDIQPGARNAGQRPPYMQSRAALRERWGSRSIGGPSKQSPLDTTPSGREAIAMQRGATRQEAAAYAKKQFREDVDRKRNILPWQNSERPTPISMPPVQQPQRPMFQGGLASPEDVGQLVQQGAIGTVKTPYGTVTLPNRTAPLPNTISAEQMAEYLPDTTGPLSNFALPKARPYLGSVMQAASRWRT